jgi:hypothetical protein
MPHVRRTSRARKPLGAPGAPKARASDRYDPCLLLKLKISWDYQMKPLSFSWGASYTSNWLEVPPDTQLANDFQSERRYVRELVGNAEQHGVPKVLARSGLGHAR